MEKGGFCVAQLVKTSLAQGVSHGAMASVIFQMMALAWSHHLFEAALMAGHLISIRTESGSIPQRRQQAAHLLCLHHSTKQPMESWSGGACGPA